MQKMFFAAINTSCKVAQMQLFFRAAKTGLPEISIGETTAPQGRFRGGEASLQRRPDPCRNHSRRKVTGLRNTLYIKPRSHSRPQVATIRKQGDYPEKMGFLCSRMWLKEVIKPAHF